MSRPNEATQRQHAAAAPGSNTWLGANAGSGKTRVLTDRVARLLLSGVSPQNILCLTYTKAAAGEMQNRLFNRLGAWAMCDDTRLAAELTKLGETGPFDAATLAKARTLFARAIETPGGLRIQTIHSFCTSVLRRFPLEAKVSPRFTDLDEQDMARLLQDTTDAIIAGPNAALYTDLIDAVSDTQIDTVIESIVSNAPHFGQTQSREDLLGALGLPHTLSWDRVLADVLAPEDRHAIAALLGELEPEKSTDETLRRHLHALPDPLDRRGLQALESAFLLSKDHSPKIDKILTKPKRARLGAQMDRINALMERVAEARQARLALDLVGRTVAIHAFAAAFLPRFEAAKQSRALLSFDDQIRRTRNLLRDSAAAAWVLYRIDGGLDHILVDEAQDTSPMQWDVIRLLAGELTAGDGAEADTGRSLFVVGDKKQSIYSFQGADPRAFDAMFSEFHATLRNGPGLQQLELEHSFRTSPAILATVDRTFQLGGWRGLGTASSHIAFWQQMSGRVDLWPLVETQDKTEPPKWFDPVDMPSAEDPMRVLATAIAQDIRRMIDSGTTLPRQDGTRRPMTAGDVLILVQRRSPLFHEIIAACKASGVPVAGADRLKLADQLAIKDIVALLRFLTTPEDSLSLAEVLRSPIGGFSEDELFRLAHGRSEPYLWRTLQSRRDEWPDTVACFEDLRDHTDFLRPYDLIERLLIRHRGRDRLVARLGPEAEDAIDAFLDLALAYETAEVPSLTGFLGWFDAGDAEVKRNLAAVKDAVRVMTVHGSKGLEAPVVILPDTTRDLKDPSDALIVTPQGDVFAGGGGKDARPQAVQNAVEAQAQRAREENQRLLYVAMTRAEVWLIVAGHGTSKPESWYGQVKAALEDADAPAFDTPTGPGQRYATGIWESGPLAAPECTASPSPALPSWVAALPPPPPPRVPDLSPSDLGGAKALPGADGREEAEALAHGTAVHRLLEDLPGHPASEWPARADTLLRSDTDSATRRAALAEATAVLSAPTLAHLFAADALCEVTLTAPLGAGLRITGAVDRLLLRPGQVTAVDFKTNATVPQRLEDVPEGLLRQMGAYAAALTQIYPDRDVQTALVWTRTACVMPLPHDMVMAALHRATKS